MNADLSSKETTPSPEYDCDEHSTPVESVELRRYRWGGMHIMHYGYCWNDDEDSQYWQATAYAQAYNRVLIERRGR